MISASDWIFRGLLGGMSNADNQSEVALEHCSKSNWGNDDAHSVANKTACKLVAAGLQYISKIQDTYKFDPKGNNNNLNPYDNQEYKQLVACLMLKRVAEEMKRRSKICNIDEGIETAFSAAPQIKSKHCNNGKPCFVCKLDEKYDDCHLDTAKEVKVKPKLESLLTGEGTTVNNTLTDLLKTDGKDASLCSRLQCLASKVEALKLQQSSQSNASDIEGEVSTELKKLLQHITEVENWKQKEFDQYCTDNIGSSWLEDTGGEKTAKQKACKLFALGLKHISEIKDNKQNGDESLRKTMMCAALNLYADQLIKKSTEQCPLDSEKLKEAIDHAFGKSKNIMGNKTASCPSGSGTSSCFICNRLEESFGTCRIGSDNVKTNLNKLIKDNDDDNTKTNNTPNMEQTLDKINSKDTFCTELQCAIIKKVKSTGKKLQNGTRPSWDDINKDAKGVLTTLLGHMTVGQTKSEVTKYCNDRKWDEFGHKGKHTNKAACLLFAAGLEHIYTHGNGRSSGPVNGPSFGQTMGCLFLKEYAKQLKEMAEKQKKYKVHPDCSVDSGIEYAFSKSKDIMVSVLTRCKNNASINDCFVCKIDQDYGTCLIGTDKVKSNVEPMLKDNDRNQNHMEKTLENTVCPILLTDILTPFLPLAPVSIGLSAMAYYLWKYFGPLGKGGQRFRRSPTEIPGSSVQEQVLDHVEEAGPHEYRLVKERKPRSAPTRTKRSGRVNRRTIIEIHFEVLDECQKGDTQLNQKDFLELLVQEFMGSELMEEEEQVPKEEVPMELVPIEEVPMERVPSLGSGFMV
ncbi:SICAvar, type I (fragment) [Plasmodium knowlesi strain H]|uniref:SICAvar, type I n=1 Tax=Plasmodium knowlesi (strain H) TaxID=5851 RepID=A0A1A7VR64_PLAKH